MKTLHHQIRPLSHGSLRYRLPVRVSPCKMCPVGLIYHQRDSPFMHRRRYLSDIRDHAFISGGGNDHAGGGRIPAQGFLHLLRPNPQCDPGPGIDFWIEIHRLKIQKIHRMVHRAVAVPAHNDGIPPAGTGRYRRENAAGTAVDKQIGFLCAIDPFHLIHQAADGPLWVMQIIHALDLRDIQTVGVLHLKDRISLMARHMHRIDSRAPIRLENFI